MNKSIVIIPTLNEANNIEKLVREIIEMTNVEILIVDDDSNDGTFEILKKLKCSNKRFNYIIRNEKHSYAKSCLDGFSLAINNGFNYILTMDADFSHPVLKINELLKYITDYDVIIGSRYVSGGGISSNWTILRKFLSKFGNILARKMLNLPVNDCTSGFRCYKTDVLKKIKYHELRSNGYALLIEIIYKLNINGFKIKEIPFLYTERTVGKSKISKKIAFEALLFVLKIAAFTMWNRLNNKFR